MNSCPMRLEPVLLDAASQKEDYGECARLNISDCVECGVCTYVCASKCNTLHSIRLAKYKMAEKASNA